MCSFESAATGVSFFRRQKVDTYVWVLASFCRRRNYPIRTAWWKILVLPPLWLLAHPRSSISQFETAENHPAKSSFLPAENSGSTLLLILHDANSPSCFSTAKVDVPEFSVQAISLFYRRKRPVNFAIKLGFFSSATKLYSPLAMLYSAVMVPVRAQLSSRQCP